MMGNVVDVAGSEVALLVGRELAADAGTEMVVDGGTEMVVDGGTMELMISFSFELRFVIQVRSRQWRDDNREPIRPPPFPFPVFFRLFIC